MKDKGNYYKWRTREWFRKKGYACEYLEKLQRIITGNGHVIFVKKDVFAADGLAMNGQEMIFWNSKLGMKNVAEGLKKFNQHPYPPGTHRWLVLWQPRAREPEIVPVPNTKLYVTKKRIPPIPKREIPFSSEKEES